MPSSSHPTCRTCRIRQRESGCGGSGHRWRPHHPPPAEQCTMYVCVCVCVCAPSGVQWGCATLFTPRMQRVRELSRCCPPFSAPHTHTSLISCPLEGLVGFRATHQGQVFFVGLRRHSVGNVQSHHAKQQASHQRGQQGDTVLLEEPKSSVPARKKTRKKDIEIPSTPLAKSAKQSRVPH